jgi:hypothetical protein
VLTWAVFVLGEGGKGGGGEVVVWGGGGEGGGCVWEGGLLTPESLPTFAKYKMDEAVKGGAHVCVLNPR